jgi:chromosome segregation ATPase
MSTKKPALSTRLKIAVADLDAAQKKITDLEAKLKSAESSKDAFYKKMNDAEAEIEQVHALLDALPGSAPRKTSEEESWSRRDIKTMTRLAAYLANRSAA